MKKALLIGLGIFATIVVAVAVIYMIRKPTPTTPTATPAPTTVAQASPTTPEVFVVAPAKACSTTIIVACASSTPSASPSASPSTAPSTPPEASLTCVSKRMYQDDSRNKAGFYYLQNEITNASAVQNGQMIVYNVLARNNGGNSAPDTTITDQLSSNLTYVDGDSACAYDNGTRVVTCTVGTLAGTSEAGRSFRVKVNVTGATSVANTADVSSSNGQRSSCSVQINATTGQVVTPPSSAPTALPVAGVFEVTAGTLGIGVFFLIAGALGLLLI